MAENKKMDLSEFATELKAKNQFIKASFGGFAGSGKSRTASEFVIGAYKQLGCTKPVLFIDNEKGSRFLIPLFQKAGIQTLVKDTINLADVLKSFEYLNSNEIDFLFIDSLSKIWYKYVRDYRENNKKQFMTLQDWGKILPSWQEQFADKFVELSGNCVFTGRGGYTYDMEENEKGKKEFVKSGVKMKMAGETPFEPDLNIWMDINQRVVDDKPEVWREALILKDRSGLIDGMSFNNPTYDAFKPVIDYLLAMPIGGVAGSSDESNLAPVESESWYKERDEREIQLELIKDLFTKNDLGGTSADTKKQKILITEKVFGTSSSKALEKMDSFTLKECKNRLEKLLANMPVSVDDRIQYIADYESDDITDFESRLNSES